MNSPRASIALISLLAISALTLILVVGMAEVSLSNAFQYFNYSSSKVSYYVAESCLEEAMLRMEGDASFIQTTLVFDGDTDCTVTVSSGNPKTVSITTTFLDYVETFEAQVSTTQAGETINASLLEWQEV